MARTDARSARSRCRKVRDPAESGFALPMSAILPADVVLTAHEADRFAELAVATIARVDDALRRRCLAVARQQTWDKRADELLRWVAASPS